MEKSKMIGLAALIVCGIAVLFAILALSLSSWQTYLHGSIGLWKLCSYENCVRLVINSSTVAGKSLMAVRAMCFLGMFCIVGALVTGVLKVFVMSNKRMIGFIASGLAIAAGVFLLIGFAVYTAEPQYDHEAVEFGAAFGLDVVGWLLSWAAGGLFFYEASSSVEVA